MRSASQVRSALASTVVFFAMPILLASTAQAVCTHAVSGQNYGSAREDGKDWGYVLHMSGDRWERMSYGWHAPGAFICRTCRAWGLYHFFAHEHALPASAAERIAQGSETFGNPKMRLGAADLIPIASRDDLRQGVFSGYAVRYRPEPWRLPKLSPYRSFLAIALTDGCIHLDATLASEDVPADWTDVLSLVAAISIERYSGGEPLRPPASSSEIGRGALPDGRMRRP